MHNAPAEAVDKPAVGDRLRLQILGPLRVWRGDVELATGPRQQARLLAILLTRVGRPVSDGELIDMTWGMRVPPSGLNTLRKYAGALRHLLEPNLPPRRNGSYLQRRGDGYLLTAGPDSLDLVAFRVLLGRAQVALAHQRYGPALDCYVQALGLWRGPAGAGIDDWASASVFAAVNAEFLDAVVAAAALAVSLGRTEQVLPPLRLAATMDPLHEPVQASFISALGAAGQQAEALAVYRTVRVRLAEELGIDPSPVLVTAHARVLGQAPPTVTRGGDDDRASRPVSSAGMVGRVQETALLSAAVESAFAGGTAVVVVEGEPGIGKTRLLEEVAGIAEQRQALVVWGRCVEGNGGPTMWPWVQIISAIVNQPPTTTTGARLSGELRHLTEPGDDALATPVLPDSGAQFRLFEQIVSIIGDVTARRPTIVVIDDVQWADLVSLQMFGHLAARLPGRTALIGALRDRAPTPHSQLVKVLAGLSRLPRHHRIHLEPLTSDEVIELVVRENGRLLEPDVARSIYSRTAGNPFFVREITRLLAAGDGAAGTVAHRTSLPSTVLDVVRHRMSGLDDDSRNLLQVAAIIGSDVEIGVLAHAIGIDDQTCLDRLEPLEGLGLIAAPVDPRVIRFAHDIVREAVVESTPRRMVSSMHLLVADALEVGKAVDDIAVERIAHHLWAAGPLADPSRTAGALICAGRAAAAKSAFETADRLLQSAVYLAQRAGLAGLELSALSHLTAVVGMRSGYGSSGLDLLQRAENLARRLGREREAADLLFSRWAAHSQGIQLVQAAPLARRLLEQGEASTDPMVRAYGWSAWGIHQWDLGQIDEAFRYLSRANSIMLEDRPGSGDGPLRRDLQLLWPVMLALMTALHGDVDAARSLLDTLEVDAEDDPYAITVWAAFSVVTAALAGDPAWASRAADRGIAVDPDNSFVFLGGYQRLARCWARALTGDDPAGAAAQAESIIGAVLLDPPRSGLAAWYGLLCEMLLAADLPTKAAEVLERAEWSLDAHGQRYPEGLLLLLRAQVQQAGGEPTCTVTATAERARVLSTERGAHLFAQRSERWLSELTRRT